MLKMQLAYLGTSGQLELRGRFLILIERVKSTLAELEALRRVDTRAELQETIDQSFAKQRVERQQVEERLGSESARIIEFTSCVAETS